MLSATKSNQSAIGKSIAHIHTHTMLSFKASLLKATEAAVASSEATLLEIDGVIMENFCSASDDIHKAALFVSIFY